MVAFVSIRITVAVLLLAHLVSFISASDWVESLPSYNATFQRLQYDYLSTTMVTEFSTDFLKLDYFGSFENSIISISKSMCDTFASSDDDYRCVANMHQTIRMIRFGLVNEFVDKLYLRHEVPMEYQDPLKDDNLISYSYVYDQGMTQNKNVCIFGCFSFRMYMFIRFCFLCYLFVC